KKELPVKQVAIDPDIQNFVIENIKIFERLYKDTVKLNELGAPDPDSILIIDKIDKDGQNETTLNSNKKIKDEIVLLKLNRMIFQPETPAESQNAEKVIKFKDWCIKKQEFTNQQMNREMKKLRIYKNENYSIEQVQRILKWFEIGMKQNT